MVLWLYFAKHCFTFTPACLSPAFVTFKLFHMKSFFLNRLLPALVLTFALKGALLAQPGSGGPGPGTPVTPTTPTDVPLDGGASLLLAGGVAYGLKRLRERRQK